MRAIQIAAEERVVVVKGGFSRLKPFVTEPKMNTPKKSLIRIPGGMRSKSADARPNYVQTEAYRELIENAGPYYYFITLTFGRNVSYLKKCQYTDRLLRRYNQKIFHHDFKKRNQFHTGFAFFEDHQSSAFQDRSHIHILLKENTRYDDFDFCSHIEIFHKVAGEVFDAKGRPVFTRECIDFQFAGDVHRIDYCMKNIWDQNIHRIKMIGKTGLSDNL